MDDTGEAPFRYVGGDPALDLINTVDWTDRGPAKERLVDYPAMLRWAEGAELIDARTSHLLRNVARRRPQEARRVMDSAHRLRAALKAVVHELAAHRSMTSAAFASRLEVVNAALGSSLARLRLIPHRHALSLSWGGSGSRLESPLWAVAWSAAQLLASPEVSKLRVCAGDNCGWVYVDRSRNGLRRWCEMSTCGTQRKTQRRRARRKAGR